MRALIDSERLLDGVESSLGELDKDRSKKTQNLYRNSKFMRWFSYSQDFRVLKTTFEILETTFGMYWLEIR